MPAANLKTKTPKIETKNQSLKPKLELALGELQTRNAMLKSWAREN
jgi:hypothetical protein